MLVCSSFGQRPDDCGHVPFPDLVVSSYTAAQRSHVYPTPVMLWPHHEYDNKNTTSVCCYHCCTVVLTVNFEVNKLSVH